MRAAGGRGGGGSRFLYDPFDPRGAEDLNGYLPVLQSFGTPEQLGAKLRAIDELLEEKKRRDWLLKSMRTVATWAAAVATGWLAFKGLLADFLTGLQQ